MEEEIKKEENNLQTDQPSSQPEGSVDADLEEKKEAESVDSAE